MKKKDIIIIGGGASGMMCAIKAKEKNKSKTVAILEKQPRIGRKLLSTGNGRCNLTNIYCDSKNYHGSFSKHADFILSTVSPERIIEEFSKIGLSTYTDEDGRVYPLSNQASSVLDILRFRLEALGVEVICDTKVMDVISSHNGFNVITTNESYNADKVVCSTGSCAAGKLGADLSGISLLQKLGHKCTDLSPALCPIPVENKKLSSLKGVRAKGEVTLFDGKKAVCTDSGEIQFTETALSGICVFNLSYKVPALRNPFIKINLLPNSDNKKTALLVIEKQSIMSERICEEFLVGLFNKKLGIYIMKASGITPLSRKVKSLNEAELNKIAYNINGLSFKVTAPSDFNSAQVVSGGINGNEIDPKTMESKIVRNLFIIGETVDVDGICGGYNLQFAFASGITAGENL